MSNNILSTIIDNSRLNSRIADIKGHKVLILSGEIDGHTAPQFRQAVMRILDDNEQHLIIDMQNVEYMDSGALGILASAMNRLSPRSGTVNLVGCNSRIDRICYLTQMSAFMTLHQNMDDALEALNA